MPRIFVAHWIRQTDLISDKMKHISLLLTPPHILLTIQLFRRVIVRVTIGSIVFSWPIRRLDGSRIDQSEGQRE